MTRDERKKALGAQKESAEQRQEIARERAAQADALFTQAQDELDKDPTSVQKEQTRDAAREQLFIENQALNGIGTEINKLIVELELIEAEEEFRVAKEKTEQARLKLQEAENIANKEKRTDALDKAKELLEEFLALQQEQEEASKKFETAKIATDDSTAKIEAIRKPVKELDAVLKSFEALGLSTVWTHIMNLEEGGHKKMYHKQSLKYHADKNSDPNAHGEFLKVRDAYEQIQEHTIKDIQHAYQDKIHKEVYFFTGVNFKEADANTKQVLGDVVSIFGKVHF